MTETTIQLESSWLARLQDQFELPYMQQLKSFLRSEKSAGKVIYPPGREMFAAFNFTPLEQVRVVILGQDPYHGPGQAHGLCFSVRHGVQLPPSLVNIYKELQSDLGVAPATHGCLTHWAEQGVGRLRAAQGRRHRHRQTPGTKSAAPLAPECASRFLWLPALQPGQQLAGIDGQRCRRLAASGSGVLERVG